MLSILKKYCKANELVSLIKPNDYYYVRFILIIMSSHNRVVYNLQNSPTSQTENQRDLPWKRFTETLYCHDLVRFTLNCVQSGHLESDRTNETHQETLKDTQPNDLPVNYFL